MVDDIDRREYMKAAAVLMNAVAGSSSPSNNSNRTMQETCSVIPTDYVLRTDGSTIDAISQTSGLSTYTDQSHIGPLLEKLIVDELPPVGSRKEAAGRIHFKSGCYEGSGSSYEVPLPTSCHITGTGANHRNSTATNKNFPETEPLVEIKDVTFVQPAVDDSLSSFARLSGLKFQGPGADETGSKLLDSSTGSNQWDWLRVEDCVFMDAAMPVHINSAHHVYFTRCHFLNFETIWDTYDKSWWSECGFWSQRTGAVFNAGGDPSANDENRSTMRTSWIKDCIFTLKGGNDGRGSVTLRRGYVKLEGCQFQNQPGTSIGKAVQLSETVQKPAWIEGNRFAQNESWDYTIEDKSAASHNYFRGNKDFSDATTSLLLNGANGLSDPILQYNQLLNGVNKINSPTRVLQNGIGRESANSRSPSRSWPVGTVVDFTDVGGGSGTGTYIRRQDGGWIQLV